MGIQKLSSSKTNFTIKEWAEIVHPSSDGYVTVATRQNDKWKEQSYPVSEWYKHIVINQKVDCYYTPNTYFIPHRATENARHLNAFYVDLDFYKYGLSLDDVLQAVDFLVNTERLLEPTFIYSSGRGAYLFWQIESVPAKYIQVLKLFNHIQSFLIDTLQDLGADIQAKDVARVLRVPTSFNTRSGEKVKILSYSNKFYTMRYLQQFMNEALMIDIETFKKPKKVIENNRKSKVKYLYSYYSLAVARANDIRTLCKLRNYDIHGNRNSFLHVYVYQMFLIHNNFHVARDFVFKLNDDLVEPLDSKELETIVKSTFKAYEKHREDVSKGYNYKNETLIELFEITADEQQHMKVLISQSEKNERDKKRKREQRRNEDGLTSREQAKKDLEHKVSEMLQQGLEQKEITLELGISKGRVSQIARREQERNEDGLTARERAKQEKISQVHKLFAKGLKQSEIALELNIGKGTVSKYLNLK